MTSFFGPRGVPVGMSADLDRVLNLPRRKPLDLDDPVACEAIVQYEMQKHGKVNNNCQCKIIDPRRPCITRLLPIQAWSLYEIALANGMLGAIPVGGGKTVLDILAVMALPNCKEALLLVPASLVTQLALDCQLISQHFKTPHVIIHLGVDGNGKPPIRITSNEPNAPLLHVLAYSMLSRPNASDWIENLKPNAIIADECDGLKDILNSSRAIRVARHFVNHPQTRFCAWTGSITNKSISEFFHLSAWALRLGSPLPLDRQVVEEWGTCLDASEYPAPAGALMKLCDVGEDDARIAFRRRLAETRGFVVATSSAVKITGGTGIVENDIREKKAPPLPEKIQQALDLVRDFQRPDTMIEGYEGYENEELEDALAQAKCAIEITCGVLYYWDFPPINGVPQEDSIIQDWYGFRALMNKEFRGQIMQGIQYLDSRNLCENAIKRAYGEIEPDDKRPSWKAMNWPAWRDIKDKVYYVPKAHRLDKYLAQDAADWGLANRGIIWTNMTEFSTWVAELSGLRYHGGGPKAGELLRKETGERSIIASLKSHGRGRDGLQHIYNHQLLIVPPAGSDVVQQMLGRTHRRGQKEASVITEVYLHTMEFRRSFKQALTRSKYVKSILGEDQKLLSGWVDDEDDTDGE